MATLAHPFETAGLGLAPFRCIGVERRVGPIKMQIAPGITSEIGAPGQPMGSCDYCGTGIADCYVILSSDGKRFIVGSDCVRRTYKEAALGIPLDVSRAMATVARDKREAKAAIAREKEAAKLDAVLVPCRAQLEAAPALLTAVPHPAIAGKTMRDYVEWMLANAGMAGRFRACSIVAAAAASSLEGR